MCFDDGPVRDEDQTPAPMLLPGNAHLLFTLFEHSIGAAKRKISPNRAKTALTTTPLCVPGAIEFGGICISNRCVTAHGLLGGQSGRTRAPSPFIRPSRGDTILCDCASRSSCVVCNMLMQVCSYHF